MSDNLEFNQLIEQCLNTRKQFEQLNLPKLNRNEIFNIEYKSLDNSIDEINLLTKFPIQETDYLNANLIELKLLNSNQSNLEEKNDDEIKRNIYEAWFEFKTVNELKFEPGDSIGCLIGNFDDEVYELINLLKLDDYKNKLIIIDNKSKTRSLPKQSTLFQLIKYSIELRAIPKKIDLLHFSEYCLDEEDKIILELLSSKEGSKLYDEFILKRHFGYLDLFKCFKSCKPNLSILLKHTINFIPRYYSIIEHQQSKNESIYINKIKFAFNVTLLPRIFNRKDTQLFGIFTGQLNQLYNQFYKNDNLIDKMNKLSIKNDFKFYIFKRKNLMFNLKSEFKNVICVSVGTGITPFLSLFKYNQVNQIKSNIYLIHGSKTKLDCLYLDELNKFNELNIIKHLKIIYSREKDTKFKYVQDYLIELKEIKELILNENTAIYVCGDQLTMVKDVFNTFKELIDKPDADKLLKEMQKNKRYLVDVWL